MHMNSNPTVPSASRELPLVIVEAPPSNFQVPENVYNNPIALQAGPPNKAPVKTSRDKRVARPQRSQAPDLLRNNNRPFGMTRYLNEALQEGGPTYSLVHTDLDSRLSAIASTLCDCDLKMDGMEDVGHYH
ncbi:hypothetical protein EV426DRAFT_578857 [Tirmania nivea]|nr:hypothetical protein EV426DRAFT_578857 [Tirmania nivea]